ncbi:hypothetical protein [Auraticoccus monumenti]|uniref:Uncharacterized protein n=1 Tax=Auraticoccus monumenti TaxID=675864 RepID=A0A1G6WBV7_9ACTN|nr:hypothetical protein [Auraticoccus monumenti]SDD63163.1 hypothetical protein SAMN04489747_1398 [Auraticoccus monumenti]
MPSWVFWLVVVAIAGVAVIVVGALRDRHVTEARRRELTSPPDRAVPGPGGDAVPHYLTDLDAGRPPADAAPTDLSPAERATLERELRTATEVPVGTAAPGFVTDTATGRAVLDHPRVLVCRDPVTSLRALLAFLEPSLREQRPCVVVAPEVHRDVLRTLEVNRLQRRLPVLVLVADGTSRAALSAATGAEPVPAADLQSGWIPPGAVGTCARLVSDRRRSWVVGAVDTT